MSSFDVVPSDIDGRTKIARRIKSLARGYISALGGNPSDEQLNAVRRASQMSAIADEARAKFMAGDASVTLTDIVRLDGTARRAVRDLHLPAAKDRAPNLDDFLSEIMTTADDGARP